MTTTTPVDPTWDEEMDVTSRCEECDCGCPDSSCAEAECDCVCQTCDDIERDYPDCDCDGCAGGRHLFYAELCPACGGYGRDGRSGLYASEEEEAAAAEEAAEAERQAERQAAVEADRAVMAQRLADGACPQCGSKGQTHNHEDPDATSDRLLVIPGAYVSGLIECGCGSYGVAHWHPYQRVEMVSTPCQHGQTKHWDQNTGSWCLDDFTVRLTPVDLSDDLF